MKIPLVDLKRQYQEIRPRVNRAIFKVLRSTNFVLGGEVAAFEKAFAQFCGAKYCVGVSSGSDALLIALKSLGIGLGDEVITAANTFAATVFSISRAGAHPVLVDINPKTYNIDPNKIEDKITSKTKAIVVVHLYGQPAQMQEIAKIAKIHRLKIIEDAAQAHGSYYLGKKTGTLGDVAAFSFYPGKNLGAYGEGGAVVTNSSKVTRLAWYLRDQGQIKKYVHAFIGYNARLDALQAAILSEKLKKLEVWNQQRRNHAQTYIELLHKLDLTLPYQHPDTKTNWHLFVIRVKKRDQLIRFLKHHGIECGIHYPIPIHLLPAYKDLGYKKGDFPESEKAAKEIVSLPMFPHLRTEEIEYVCAKINKFVSAK